MIDKKNNIITLSNGKRLLVLENVYYNDCNYYIACEVDDEGYTSEEFRIFQIEVIDGEEIIKSVKDEKVFRDLVLLFDSKVNHEGGDKYDN